MTTITAPSEFTLVRPPSDRARGPARWIWSHAVRYWPILTMLVLGAIGNASLAAAVPVLVGSAFNEMLGAEPGLHQSDPPRPDPRRIADCARHSPVWPQLRRRVDGPASGTRHPRRDLRLVVGQEHDLPQPAARRRHHGARHQRRARDQPDVQPGRQPGGRRHALHGGSVLHRPQLPPGAPAHPLAFRPWLFSFAVALSQGDGAGHGRGAPDLWRDEYAPLRNPGRRGDHEGCSPGGTGDRDLS